MHRSGASQKDCGLFEGQTRRWLDVGTVGKGGWCMLLLSQELKEGLQANIRACRCCWKAESDPAPP
eukprot:scaffold199446_cov18-Tisochrysis_lutea.AAC.1